MTAGEFNELAKQRRVWAKIVANFSGKYGLVEKISGLTNQFVRFRFKGKKCDTIISPEYEQCRKAINRQINEDYEKAKQK